MKKVVLLLSVFVMLNVTAQKYFTRTGHVYLFSHTDIIDINGNNHHVVSFLDIQTGEMAFAVLIKAFEFTLANIEKRFNETCMESQVYPKSRFTGRILEMDNIDLTINGIYEVTVEGDLTIHGVTKRIREKGTLESKNGKISGKSKMKIAIDDYNINVPNFLEDRFAKIVDVQINLKYMPFNNL